MEITKYIEKVDKIYKECKEERKVEGINVQGLSNSINKEISISLFCTKFSILN